MWDSGSTAYIYVPNCHKTLADTEMLDTDKD